jgi:type I restriction-modification system DNA methylase subunit|nr:N-6 DNA methylase [Pseudanabaena cinerea]
MAIKKSDLYSSLWASCDELRGGMDASQYNFPTARILNGNTLAAPKFRDGEQLRTYDYVVANPPFSDKTWSTGLTFPEVKRRGFLS